MNALKTAHLVLAVAASLTILYSGAYAEEEESGKQLKPQTTCPIMGGGIDKSLYVDHDGKRIYVCCQGCIAAVKKNPAAAVKKLADAGQKPLALPRKQATCPVMGGKINEKLFVEHRGKKIYVCCQGCVATVKKHPAKYAQKVEEAIQAEQEAPKDEKRGAKAHHDASGHSGHH